MISCMEQLAEFDEIRPVADHEIRENLEALIEDRQFKLLLKSFVPWCPNVIYKAVLRLSMVGVRSSLGFQKRYMWPVMRWLIAKATQGLSFEHSALSEKRAGFTYISNHRDIVLDAALLDVALIDNHFPNTVQIAIGDNLLIYPWIRRLVRMNKAFIVKRSVGVKELLAASKLMSRYMQQVIATGKDNIWIAQREGRAKDSDDRTQPSVLRMMTLGGEGSAYENLKAMQLVPLTISYEYDPCDYLKAKEFLLKRDNPAYKKSKKDDLDNMRTGILGQKGRVHYHLAAEINSWLENYAHLPEKAFFEAVAARIDVEIHKNYRLFASNYVAADLLEQNHRFAAHYSAAEKLRFEQYLADRLALIVVENKDEAFLKERILTMYANPLYNYLRAHEG